MITTAKTSSYMDKNGAIKRTNEAQLQSYLLSIITAATLGCFAFLWNLNASVTKLEQQDIETARALDELRLRINNMQLDIRDVRERMIRIETINQRK